jgi:partner of Y14 and mago
VKTSFEKFVLEKNQICPFEAVEYSKMPPKNQDPEVSNSGITTGADGQRHIPSSVRADGSIRKEIKIRPGYRPPEDIEAYKNRTAEAWRNRGKGGIPGAEAVEGEKTGGKESSTTSKNAKRREARKRAAEKEKQKEVEKEEDEPAKVDDAEGSEEAKPGQNGQIEAVDLEVENEKEARKLAKKLRQARELKDRKEKGDSLLPEQLEKVIRINELIRQLDSLGFDGNGERKEKNEET